MTLSMIQTVSGFIRLNKGKIVVFISVCRIDEDAKMPDEDANISVVV